MANIKFRKNPPALLVSSACVMFASTGMAQYASTEVNLHNIGDLPAISIGEVLEPLMGAASHGEQGGATEISIRGMGSYLGSIVINGREATNDSDS